MATADEGPGGQRRASVPEHLVPGLVVAEKYELVRKIGSGAMGEVWAARHRSLDEEVAIKLVMRGVDHDDGTSAESRFLLEARVAAALSRKTRHIVAVTDHGQDGALGYLVMELLAGEPLDQRIQRTGRLSVARAAPLVSQIARALATAHAEGVVHRDLKPSNVFVTTDEEGRTLAKVLDFGIAKLKRTSDKRAAHSTQRGFLLGTPAYMSPEQARGKPIDHRTDVWALAVIAYHLLTGEFPFDGETGEELFARICRVAPIALSDRLPDAPAIVNDFFVRAFATRIEDRFQSATALAGAFEQLAPLSGGAPLSAPPPETLAMGEAEIEAVRLGARPAKSSGASTMIAAGVPTPGGRWRSLAVVALLAIVLVATGAVLSVYYEREPARATAPAPAALPPSAAITVAPREIPPPEPAPEPSPPTLASSAAAPRAPSRRVEPPPALPSAAATPAITTPATKAPVDKSDVF